MTWIQTFTGAKMHPLDPRVKDIRLKDISHALSNMCRFNGHCHSFYSVAQHSVHVYEEAKKQYPNDLILQKSALLHDAAEAYLPDICRPIKDWFLGFKDKEAQLLKVIFDAFDTPWPNTTGWSIVKSYDNDLLATECRDLLQSPESVYGHLGKILDRTITPQFPSIAEQMFLNACQELELTTHV